MKVYMKTASFTWALSLIVHALYCIPMRFWKSISKTLTFINRYWRKLLALREKNSVTVYLPWDIQSHNILGIIWAFKNLTKYLSFHHIYQHVKLLATNQVKSWWPVFSDSIHNGQSEITA